jgi:hypothetical protein
MNGTEILAELVGGQPSRLNGGIVAKRSSSSIGSGPPAVSPSRLPPSKSAPTSCIRSWHAAAWVAAARQRPGAGLEALSYEH